MHIFMYACILILIYTMLAVLKHEIVKSAVKSSLDIYYKRNNADSIAV